HEEKVGVLEEWEKENPGKERPDYFVAAMDLSPEEHVKAQAATQKWVDSAISKTCNCPADYTMEQTKELYELMYKLGCKGGTIYRDKCRDEQVLHLKEDLEEKAEEKKSEAKVEDKPQPKVRPRPYKRYGATVSKDTPAGTAHITMNDDEAERPFEVFVDIGKGGSDIKAMAEALGRLASLVLRVSSPLTPRERIQEIVNQLTGIGGPRSTGFGRNRVRSLPDALAQALEEQYLLEDSEEDEEYYGTVADYQVEIEMPAPQSGVQADLCPSCGNTSLVAIEGCQSCYNCGHSEC
ncbi:MAG: ribonucleoside-diphosphate reductase, adenosylcobalamin-dependent, partial [Candidatus Eremiobacteraeota bacterium]|nr:ribonucleoside-diphosphate reductase, adenosylcobalamin-dependent [Candidatus Eremiobacteraeota bacterium]